MHIHSLVLIPLLIAASIGGLDALMVSGGELHLSLVTPPARTASLRHVAPGIVQSNPQHSTNIPFVQAIASSGSQGRLDGAGLESALFALHVAERDLGFYGMEAMSMAQADLLEAELREIWKRNVSLDRAQIHREGRVLVVVWNDGIDLEIWTAVNGEVAR